MAERNLEAELDSLRRGIDEIGERMGGLGRQRWRQSRAAAGGMADAATRHGREGLGNLQGGIEHWPLTTVAAAFLIGGLLGALVTGGLDRR